MAPALVTPIVCASTASIVFLVVNSESTGSTMAEPPSYHWPHRIEEHVDVEDGRLVRHLYQPPRLPRHTPFPVLRALRPHRTQER